MSKKRMLVELGLFDKLASSFFKAKGNNSEAEWISKIRNTNPELANLWAKWDTDMNKALEIGRQGVEKFAKDLPKETESNIDRIMRQYK
jgi:hypothetical protein